MSAVDVVVPCYNYARYLQHCVFSVLEQPGVDVRVLIIDDASSDDTPEVGARLAAADRRVEFRRHAANKGHIATYNEGLLGWARAEHSLLISADDALAPGALRRAVTVMERHRDVSLVYGMSRVIRHEDSDDSAYREPAPEYRIIPGPAFLQFCCETCFNPVPTPTAVVRTASQQRLGGYRADLPHTGDLEMWMRFAADGPVAVLRAVQAEYRWHGANMGLQYYNRFVGDRREFAATCRMVLDPLHATLPASPSWLESMHRTLLAQACRQFVLAFDAGDRQRYQAWSGLIDEMIAHTRSGSRPWKLQARRLCGNRLWRALRGVRQGVRGTPPAATGKQDLPWNPSHGEINGWWPAEQTGWQTGTASVA